MATTESRKAPFFFSWSRENTEEIGQNSLAKDVDVVGVALREIQEQEVKELILITPWWPSKSYFPVLQEMLLDCHRL